MMPLARLEIRGQVQGVGFRWFVREQARRHGVAGWVRNLPSGAVELEAGSEDDESFTTFLTVVRRGPSGASVELVIELPTQKVELPLPAPFEIRR